MQAANKEHLYKLLVIGDLGVGKTSIIKRYVHQNFSSHYRATIGVDFALKVLHWDPDTVVRLQLWDIAGENPGRRSRAAAPRSLFPAPSRRVAAKGESQAETPGGAAPKETFPGGLETWLQRKQKSFSLSLKLCSAFSGAWSGCCNHLPRPFLGAFSPARASPGRRGRLSGVAVSSWPPAHFPGSGLPQSCWGRDPECPARLPCAGQPRGSP